MDAARWIRALCLAGVLLAFTVVVLGAYVRLTAAGLGCPDWPGCYGHVTPSGAEQNPASIAAYPNQPLEIGKAWREMIHRYAATTLGLIIVAIGILAMTTRRAHLVSIAYAAALLGTVIFQGVLGMLTVTLRLKPLIVTGHLIFGLTTLGMLWWLWLALAPQARSLSPRARSLSRQTQGAQSSRGARRLALLGLCALAAQIALGGWTSSNYAAIACPDFPKCQNAWLPAADFRGAFVLWQGLQVNYEGGVLGGAARTAIHLTHRTGALLVALTLGAAAVAAMTAASAACRATGALVLGALALQLTIGIAMVLRGFPLWLATAHTAGAALLMLATLALVQRLGNFGWREQI